MSAPLLPLIARDVVKAYADRVVLHGVDLVARPGEPTGLVGENGVGKSTLLRVLAGVEPADSGTVDAPADIAFLPQEPAFEPGDTVAGVMARALAPLHRVVAVIEESAEHLDDPAQQARYAEALEWAEHHEAWDADRRAQLAADRLGLGTLAPDRPASTLSGGQRSRLAMAAMIARRPDAVLLDEPTNHLDDDALGFVEEFLTTLPGVVLVATHDRVFLDRVCRVVVDLDAAHFGVDGEGGSRFSGGFSDYLAAKKASRARWEEAFAAERDELDRLRHTAGTTARQVAHDRPARDNDKFWYHFKAGNVASTIRRRVRDAERRIEVIERSPIPKPPAPLSFRGSLMTAAAGDRVVVSGRDIVVSGRVRLDRLDVRSGERLLLTGSNGSGKSSLLAAMAGVLRLDSGHLDVAARRVALLPQTIEFRRPARSAADTFADKVGARAPLATMGLVHPRDIERPVGELSLGQQRRLALAMAIASAPDLLLLDEPTNHISLALATELEEAVAASPGTLVIATHDRWLRGRWDGPGLSLSPCGR